MTEFREIMIDADREIWRDGTIADKTIVPGVSSENWSVSMRRLRGGLSDGVDVVTVDNGRLRIDILPTRGMGIWRAVCDGVPVEWKSPVERPVHPAFVDQSRRGGIGWLDGFNELLCRCGLAWHGAPGNDVIRDAEGNVVSEQFLPLHGRIANLAAHHVRIEVTSEEGGTIRIIGVVDEAGLFGGRLRLTSTLTTKPGSDLFEINDDVSNCSGAAAETEMLYHINIGRPFLEEGSIFHSASTEIAPRDPRAAEGIGMWNLYQAPTPGYAEQVYFTRPAPDPTGCGIGLLANATEDKAVAVRFDLATLPWLILWKNTQDERDGYVTGIEPGGSFPNLRSVERRHGRVRTLQPDETVRYRLSIQTLTERSRVKSAIDETTTRQVATERMTHTAPKTDWSA
ncbi:MAG: aldose 1-epimerase family protein [Planctomycetaceae bacterium]|nr:aldose 1-epimerase family protein [Planctomycetaceae bacterium]